MNNKTSLKAVFLGRGSQSMRGGNCRACPIKTIWFAIGLIF
jgi:hypothetical protein